MSDRLVSVIIPTSNSASTLKSCLTSIKSQTHKEIEVIIVDNFSKDDTKNLAEKFGAKLIKSKVGRSFARNLAIHHSKGGLVLSIDSDMELTPQVIEECINRINRGFDAVVIPEFSIGIGFWAKCRALEKSCYLGDALIEAPRFFKKSTILKIGGYDSSLETGEDWDINIRIKKAGFKITRVDRFIIHNEGNLLFGKSVLKKYWYGKTMKRYSQKHPDYAKKQFSFVRPALFGNWKKLLSDPTHAIGLIVLKGCEFVAIMIGSINKNDVPGTRQLN